jgi:hypothetical protein
MLIKCLREACECGNIWIYCNEFWMTGLIVVIALAPAQEQFLAIKCGLTLPMDSRY